MSRFAAVAALLVACEPSPPPPRSPLPKAPVPSTEEAWAQARERRLLGLGTPKARAEYVSILSDVCEKIHDPRACVEASTVDTKVARTLLFHGCFLGAGYACEALMNAEMTEDRRSAQDALADARRALAEGCTYDAGNACAALPAFDGNAPSMRFPADTKVMRLQGSMALPKETPAELLVTRAACILACTEEQKACKQRCSIGAPALGECVHTCSDLSVSCARTCRQDALRSCQARDVEPCDVLK